MKSIFPNADETVILECLQNNENSIQKTSDLLKEMGYSKKETMKPATPKTEPKAVENLEMTADKVRTPSPAPKLKTSQEKQQSMDCYLIYLKIILFRGFCLALNRLFYVIVKEKLQEQYKDVPEHLISIALESVNFNENRANQILQIMKQEDNETQNNNKPKKAE